MNAQTSWSRRHPYVADRRPDCFTLRIMVPKITEVLAQLPVWHSRLDIRANTLRPGLDATMYHEEHK